MTPSSSSAVLLPALFALACSPQPPSPERGLGFGGASLSEFGLNRPREEEAREEHASNEKKNPWLDPERSGESTSEPPPELPPSMKPPAEPSPEPVEPAELWISFYEETKTAEKYLEIMNLSLRTTTSGECLLSVHANGNTSAYRRIQLPALAPGQARLFCTTGAQREGCSAILGSSPFNGNDALVLSCRGEITDSFGRVGEDPGLAWQGGGVSSRDQALVRCGDRRDRVVDDPFVIELDWVTWLPSETRGEARLRCPRSSGGEGGAFGASH